MVELHNKPLFMDKFLLRLLYWGIWGFKIYIYAFIYIFINLKSKIIKQGHLKIEKRNMK